MIRSQEPAATGAAPSVARAEQLGAFVRAARERLRPEALGLPAGRRRRARGLRREEVAALCGISPTWYTWIEQGRTLAVSVATLEAIAQGLRLVPAERAYLFRLAARADPQVGQASTFDPHADEHAELVRMVRCPAYVLDAHWDVLAHNRKAQRLLRPWLTGARTAEPNLLRWVFLHAAARDWIVDWESRAHRLAAEYRADTAHLRDDPRHRRFVAALCEDSAEFARAWGSQQVLEREGGLRAFATADGVLEYRQFTLRLAARGGVKLILLQPLSDAAREDRTAPRAASHPPAD